MRRDHHRKILAILQELDSELFTDCSVFFGGGTAISLLNNEYRLSTDIDFLCSDGSGYSEVMNRIFDSGLSGIFKNGQAPHQAREVRRDRDGIRTVIEYENTKIKFEIIKESRIPLVGEVNELLPVPVLTKTCLFAEKLLANTDRGLDRFCDHKDLLDLIMMQLNWGSIPAEAIELAESAYGKSIFKAYERSHELLSSEQDLEAMLSRHGIDRADSAVICNSLKLKEFRSINKIAGKKKPC